MSNGRPSRKPPAREPLRWLENVALGLAAALIAWVVISIAVAIFSRYFFNKPLAWTIELSEYSLLFLTFLAVPAVARSRGHVRLELITAVASPRLVRALDTIGLALGALIGWFVAAASLFVTYENVVKGARTAKILPIPRWVVTSGIAVGMVLFAIEQTRQFILIRQGKLDSTSSEADADSDGPPGVDDGPGTTRGDE